MLLEYELTYSPIPLEYIAIYFQLITIVYKLEWLLYSNFDEQDGLGSKGLSVPKPQAATS
jgi:hypothetical protein